MISSRYTVNIFVEEGAILVKFTATCEEEISANLGMSFAAGLKRAGRMLTSFCSMLLATILTVLTVAVLVVTTYGNSSHCEVGFLKYLFFFVYFSSGYSTSTLQLITRDI